jgi:transcriptional regulator with XRE-family HTH domain
VTTSNRSWADFEADAKLDFDPRETPDYQKSVWGPELGALLRHARQKAAMTQMELASQVGLRQPNIARLEAGANVATVETLARIANALDQKLVVGIVSDADAKESLTEMHERGQLTFGLSEPKGEIAEGAGGVANHLFGDDGSELWHGSHGARGLMAKLPPEAATQWRQLIQAVAARTGEDKSNVSHIVQGLIDVVSSAVAKGRDVELPGFARFSRKEHVGSMPYEQSATSAHSTSRDVAAGAAHGRGESGPSTPQAV